MAELYSQFTSGTQITAGTIVGSALGASGLNAYADRLNSITQDNGILSGTTLAIYASGINKLNLATMQDTDSVASTTSATYVDAAGILGSIVTAGNSVLAMFTSSATFGNLDGNEDGDYRIIRRTVGAGSAVSSAGYYSNANALNSPYFVGNCGVGINWIDTPVAGSHTYGVEMKVTGGETFSLEESQIIAIELTK